MAITHIPMAITVLGGRVTGVMIDGVIMVLGARVTAVMGERVIMALGVQVTEVTGGIADSTFSGQS